MKLYKYIIISAILHLAVISAFSVKRDASVSLGVKGGEISVLFDRGDSTGNCDRGSAGMDYGDVSAGEKSADTSDDNDSLSDGAGGGKAGGLYGAVGRLVAEAYRNNPPDYPAIARAMGYQGRVTLLLEVMPDGSCGSVDITRSSGYAILDTAALRAARGWIFFTDNSIVLASPVKVSQDIIFMLKSY